MIKRTRMAKSRCIAEHLREELSSTVIRRGMPAASARELAGKFGVSLPTAHNAINLLVREGLLYRVPGSGTFFNRDSAAKVLRIGLADQTVSTYLAPEVNRILNFHFEMAVDCFRTRGCSVKILSYDELMSLAVLHELDGLLVSCMFLDERSLSLIHQSGLPWVAYRYDYPEALPGCSKVEYDLRTGCEEALRLLNPVAAVSVLIIYEPTFSGNAACNMWKTLLDEHHFPANKLSLYTVPVVEREISCYRLVRVQPEKFRNAIILTGNDEIAGNITNALSLEGMSAGMDYRLVSIGYRESYAIGFMERKSLASVEKPIQTMSEEAAKLLLHKIENQSSCEYIEKVPTRFIPRNSALRILNIPKTSPRKGKEK